MATSPRILAATDFSGLAERAVTRAALLAAEFGGRLDIVHAARRREPSLLSWLRRRPAGAAALVAAGRRMDDAVDLAGRLGVEQTRGHVVTGATVPTIAAQARRFGSGLVVVGAGGQHRARDLLLGTTDERLIERLPCHVLVARRPLRAPYRKIVVCVDDSPGAVAALRWAATFAAAAQLHVVHAYLPPLESVFRGSRLDRLANIHRQAERRRARAALDELLVRAGVEVDDSRIVVQSGHPPRVIERAVGQIAPDLVAVGHHSSLLGTLFLGSVARQVLRLGGSDVLVARA